MGMIGVGFCGYMILERTLRAAAQGGDLGPASLTAHSLVDGLGIGLAFQIAPAIGVVVAVAVLAHDIADGVNTVTLSLSSGGGAARARSWLIADAAAPLVGIGLTRLFSVGPGPLGLAVALSPGFPLYRGQRARPGQPSRPASGVDQPRHRRRHGGDLAGGAAGDGVGRRADAEIPPPI
ncbi:MAG: hypothetical protein WDM85_02960 [Caulobacteraceae bacterium]